MHVDVEIDQLEPPFDFENHFVQHLVIFLKLP